jgi:hypothetical protein
MLFVDRMCVQIYPSSSRRLYLPIVPVRAGKYDVTVEGITGVNRHIVSKPITVVVGIRRR